MSDEDQLRDLLHTASQAIRGDLRPEPVALIARARRTRCRSRLVGVAGVAAIVLAGFVAIPPMFDGGDGGVEVVAADSDGRFAPGWTRLPDPPLSPRTDVTAASVGDDVVVAGGWQHACGPPPGSCVPRPPLADGAAFNLATRTWRPIAPAPLAFTKAKAAVVDGEMFVIAPCGGAECGDAVVLRYRPADDAWDALPAIPTADVYELASSGRELLALVATDKGQQLDWRFDAASSSWVELPNDPLPPSYNRHVVADDDDLLLFANEIATGPGGSNRVIGARLDLTSEKWSELPPAPGSESAFQPRLVDGVTVNPDLPDRGAHIFDLVSNEWRSLPVLPNAADLRIGLAGVLRQTSSVYTSTTGWVLDAVGPRWIELPKPVDRQATVGSSVGSTVTSIGRRLFLAGGEVASATGPGELLNDAWVWTPPPARAQAEPFPTDP